MAYLWKFKPPLPRAAFIPPTYICPFNIKMFPFLSYEEVQQKSEKFESLITFFTMTIILAHIAIRTLKIIIFLVVFTHGGFNKLVKVWDPSPKPKTCTTRFLKFCAKISAQNKICFGTNASCCLEKDFSSFPCFGSNLVWIPGKFYKNH